MKRIIFLDIDGVMASLDFLCNSYHDGVRRDEMPGHGYMDPDKVKLLNRLKGDGVEILISSSWGTTAIEPLKELGCEIPIIGTINHYWQDWICRGSEIDEYLVENFGSSTKWGDTPHDVEYVIFDDDADMLLGQVNHFIQTNRETALTEEDIEKAKEILKLK